MPSAAIAVPGTIVATISLVMVIMAATAGHPMWRTEPMNMSEAAAMRDAATVLRLVRGGENPRQRRHVRAGFLFARSVRLTPIEAAIAAGRSEIVDVLIGAGEAATWPEWVHARCLAARAGDAETERLLDAHRPRRADATASEIDCTTVVRPW